jgi:hypothetical protein
MLSLVHVWNQLTEKELDAVSRRLHRIAFSPGAVLAILAILPRRSAAGRNAPTEAFSAGTQTLPTQEHRMKNLFSAVLLLGMVLLIVHVLDTRDQKREEDVGNTLDYSWSEVRDIFAREQELEDEWLKMSRFQAILQNLKSRVRASEGSVAKAGMELVAAAHEYNPKLLPMLRERYPELDDEVCGALLVVQHLEWEVEGQPLDCLRAELEQLPGLTESTIRKLLVNPRVVTADVGHSATNHGGDIRWPHASKCESGGSGSTGVR